MVPADNRYTKLGKGSLPENGTRAKIRVAHRPRFVPDYSQNPACKNRPWCWSTFSKRGKEPALHLTFRKSQLSRWKYFGRTSDNYYLLRIWNELPYPVHAICLLAYLCSLNGNEFSLEWMIPNSCLKCWLLRDAICLSLCWALQVTCSWLFILWKAYIFQVRGQ